MLLMSLPLNFSFARCLRHILQKCPCFFFFPIQASPRRPFEIEYNSRNELKDSVNMNPSLIELQIPQEILERARQIATESNRTVESVLLDAITLLFGTLPNSNSSLDALKSYNDELLWAVVHQRLLLSQDTRLRQLVELGKRGLLSDDEKGEMQDLMDLVDHQMLLRSEALLLLKQRGHDVEQKLRLGV